MHSGRREDHTTKILDSLFRQYEEQIIENDKVAVPKNGIWSFIRTKHSIKKTDKAIYNAAKRWKSKREQPVASDNEFENDISMETSMERSIETSTEEFSSPKVPKDKGKKFVMQFSSKQWNTIKPVEVSYARKRGASQASGVRKYKCLQPGLWTEVFSKEIAKRNDIPCAFVFKNNKCYSTGETFVKIQGKCSICSSVLAAVIKKEPMGDEPCKVNAKVHGINVSRHKNKTAKIKVTNKIAERLYTQKKPATTIRRNLLKKSSQMFQAPTGRIMSANAIRCGQYRQRRKQKINECPFTALTYLQSSNMYKNCIQRVNYDPFAAFYTTPDQIKLYQEYKKRNPITKVKCDATGGLVHKLGVY